MSRYIKQRRRTKDEIAEIKKAATDALKADNPMTVRQVFYRLVTLGVIDKTENEYKSTVVRLLGDMRRSGEIPFDWISDNTRWMRKPKTYNSLADVLEQSAKFYRRNLWAEQSAYVEIWLEKEALAGVLSEVTEEWDVPLMITRGYASLSYLHGAAAVVAHSRKPVYLYYFGDYDPSGLDIARAVEEGIREFSSYADIHFERVAVTTMQITAWSLPTRPTKKTDSRSKGFQGDSVEVDAIPPAVLRELATQCIGQHIDSSKYKALLKAEAAERSTLEEIAASLPNWRQ